MNGYASKSLQPPRFRWWALLLWGAYFAALMVVVTAYSSYPPDPEYWGADYVAYIYYSRAVAGFVTGLAFYVLSIWIRRALFRRNKSPTA